MLYTAYSEFISRYFKGGVRKIPVDAGASCPVRDGRLSRGGCAFCNARSFVPDFCNDASAITRQIDEGKNFFARKVRGMKEVSYLAYFQSGTNTYPSVEVMRPLVQAALSVEGVKGVVLATRPDCLPVEWLDYLSDLSKRTFVMVEVGAETLNAKVLLSMGRGHGVEDTVRAIEQLRERSLPVCVHTILGLPGESKDSMLLQAEEYSRMKVDVLKLHQLQILWGARLENEYRKRPERFHLFDLPEYVSLVCDYLERLSADVAVERFVSQSPASQLIAPRWGVKNDTVRDAILSELSARQSFQGRLCPI